MSQSAARLIPNLDRLYADPFSTLAQEEIRIAPARKRALFVGVAVLAGLAPLLIRYKLGLVLSLPTHAAIMATIVVVLFWVVACLGHYNEKVTVHVPICQGCLEETRRRQRRGQWAGAAIGLLLGLLATLAFFTWRPNADQAGSIFFGGMISLIGIWVGYQVGYAGARFPVRACYSPRNNTLAFRFRSPDYAESFRAFDPSTGQAQGTQTVES
jgi:Na+/proline symporter